MKKLLSIVLLLISANFAKAQFLLLLTPNGGETFAIGSQQTITWASIGINKIDIEYSTDNGVSYISIDTSVSVFTNSYTWTVSGPASSNAIIRLTESTTAVVNDISNATFNIVNPSLQITYPTSGLMFNPGQQINVTWSGNIVGSEVCLLFSSDNGSNYDTITAFVPNTFNYNWTIPPVASTACRIKILDVSTPSVLNISDAFTIEALPSSGTVLTPNGGENLNATTVYNITWTASGTSIVDLEYSTNGGTSWQVIAQQIPSQPSTYPWLVPSVTTNNAKVRLKNAINGLVLDESNNLFIITQPIPSLNLISPFGFETFAIGSTHQIQWNYNFISTLKIEYSTDGGNTFTMIAPAVNASVLGYNWIVPATASSNCFIKLSDNNSSLVAQNQSPFSIVNPSITVISPNGGETFNPTSVTNITWSGAVASGLIKIELSTNNGSTWAVIANQIPNTGTFQWTIPNLPSTNCRIRISDALLSTINDQSNSNFIISTPTPIINLLSPNGGEQIAGGTNFNIIWSTINIANIKIEFSANNGATWNIIEALYPANAGNYIWFVPIIESDSMLIKISNAANVNINDVSNAFFTIYTPANFVDLLYPVGGEQLFAGIDAIITWNSLNINFVTLEYSINNGLSWELIASGISATPGAYHWNVPNVISNNVKVRIRDSNNAGNNDQSALFCSIAQPSLSFSSFPSGSTYSIFTNLNLLWLSSGLNNQTLRLEYSSNNGANWTTFASGLANNGLYNWLINCLPNNSYQFKISVESNPSIFATTSGSIQVVSSGPAIIVLSPYANENLTSGGTYNITWNSYGINYVRIEYSINGDSTYQMITPFTPATTGSFLWQVPQNLNASNCNIKISNAANTGLNALTPFSFNIQTGQMYVSSGNFAGINISGNTDLISWYATAISPYIDIHYSVDSINWMPIVEHHPNTGLYSWSIPYINADTLWYRVRDHLNPNVADVNDMPQQIISNDSLLALTLPDSSSLILSGSQFNITWDSYGLSNVDIDFSSDNGNTWSNIAGNIDASLHLYQWQVPLITTSNAIIRIKNSDYPAQFSQSNSPFIISNSFLSIASPNGGETLSNNSSYYITWQSLGVNFVDLYFSTDGGQTYNVLDTNLFNTGYFNWQVSSITSSNCKIKIADSDNQYFFDESNSVFSINNPTPSLSLLSPNGGEQFIKNNAYYIEWQSAGITHVNLSYSLNGGTTYLTLANNIPAIPSYFYWLVPDTISLNAKIKITASSNPALNDVSASNFTISDGTSQLDLLTPNGGQTFNSFSYQTIKWNAVQTPFVKLYYSINGGVTYTYINAVLNDSVYIWQVPAVSSNACRVKIENGNNASVFDASSAPFSINNQPLSTNQIDIDSLSNQVICSGNNLSISYTVSGNFNPGNNFRVQLSNPNGTFGSFTDIGGISATGAGNIQCNIPNNVVSGNAYSLRIVSDNPAKIGANYAFGSISVRKANAEFNADKQLVLFPSTVVNFSPNASNASLLTSNWNTGNGGNYSTYNAQHAYNTAGKYSVIHTVTDTLGCLSSTAKNRMISVERPFENSLLISNSNEDIIDIAFENDVYGCAILKNGNCLVSNDSGKTWILTYTNPGSRKLNAIAMFNNAWHIVTNAGTYLKSTDKGLTWVENTFNNYESLRDMHFISTNNILTAGNNGKVIKFNGTLWQNQTSGNNQTLNKIAHSGNLTLIVGDNASILKLQNNSWQTLSCPINVNLNSICLRDSTTGFIAGDYGFILKTIDGGNTWNVALSGADVMFTDIVCKSDSVWAVGSDGIIYTSTDNGSSWQRFSSGSQEDLNSIIYKQGKGFITGNDGILRTFKHPYYIPVVNSTQEPQAFENLSCFPNPTNEKLFIQLNNVGRHSLNINLSDIGGKKVYESNLTNYDTSAPLYIDMSPYKPGIYFMCIADNNTIKTFKIVKSN